MNSDSFVVIVAFNFFLPQAEGSIIYWIGKRSRKKKNLMLFLTVKALGKTKTFSCIQHLHPLIVFKELYKVSTKQRLEQSWH